MATQYTTILKLALPVQGELSGTWGDVVNDNITSMVEQAVAGKATINSWTANAHTLTTADGTTAEARCAILELTDTGTSLSGAGSVVCPANSKLYIVDNGTAQIITLKTASGTGVAVPVGKTMVAYCDGTNVVEGITNINSLGIGGDGATVTGIKDEDDMASNSAVKLATQQSIKAYVDAQVDTVDTLAEILAIGNTTSGTDISVSTDDKVQFRDAAIYINSSADGQLDIVADTEIQIATTTVDLNGALDVSGAATFNTSVAVDNITLDGNTISTTNTNGNLTITPNGGGNVNINTDSLAIQGTEGEGPSIRLQSDESDDNGDEWTFTSNTDQSLTILNNISGSSVAQMTLTPHATVASSTTAIAGLATVAGTLGVTGVVTANAGVVVDNFTLDGTTLALSSGNMELDVAGWLNISADDGGSVYFSDGGVTFGRIYGTNSNVYIKSQIADKDIIFEGVDDGSAITALTLDMSDAGAAHFNQDIYMVDDAVLRIGTGQDFRLYHDGSHSHIHSTLSDGDIFIKGNDGGSTINALSFDMSEAGAATFNSNIVVNGNVSNSSGTMNINSAGTFTIDSGGDINLDADGGGLLFKDGGTEIGRFFNSSSDFVIKSIVQDQDLKFQGNDGGSAITALTFDMSDAGHAKFNYSVSLVDNAKLNIGTGADLQLYHDASDSVILDQGVGNLLVASNSFYLRNAANDETMLRADENSYVKLYYDNAEKLSTVTGGIQVTGNISNASGDFTLDVAGDINLDADGGDIIFRDGGTTIGHIYNTNAGNFTLYSAIADKDTIFQGNDGGSTITALTLDMSAAGAASFNNSVTYSGDLISSTSGTSNFRAGVNAGNSIASGGNYNVCVGDEAGTALSTGDDNTFVGYASGDAVDEGKGNVAIGYNSLSADEFGCRSVAIGHAALLNQSFTSETNTFNVAIGYSAGAATTTGVQNTIIGGEAGDALNIGGENVVIGYNALTDSQESVGNVAIGHEAAANISDGDNNIAIGKLALFGAAGATSNNVAIGAQALRLTSTGGNNVAIGYTAAKANTTGNSSVAIGYESLLTEDTGRKNVAIGFETLKIQNADVDNHQTVVGYRAGYGITAGIENTLIGSEAGDAISDADANVAVGKGAMGANELGSHSTAVGTGALSAQNPGAAVNMLNTAVGYVAGGATTTGIKNTFIGGYAGYYTTTGESNTFVGYNTGQGITGTKLAGNDNTAVGRNAGLLLQGAATRNTLVGAYAGDAITAGDQNTALGYSALGAGAASFYNTAVGHGALNTDTTGRHSVAVGLSALYTQNNTGSADMYNVAVGSSAGYSVTTGYQSTYIGGKAGNFATTADGSTFVGFQAGQGITGTKLTGNNNTAVGKDAGLLLQGAATNNTFVGALAGDATDDGAGNVAVGHGSLSANCGDDNSALGQYALAVCTGGKNTAIGQTAGYAVTSGSNNLLLGADAGRTGSPGGNITDSTDKIILGDENIATAYIQVDWTVSSDERDKTDFTALDLGLDFVKALAPVTYKWDKRSKYVDKTADDYDLNTITHDGTHKEDWLDVGFKAQDVETLEKAAGYKIADKTNLVTSLTGDGKQYGLQYSKFVPILVKAIQEQQTTIEALTPRITALEA